MEQLVSQETPVTNGQQLTRQPIVFFLVPLGLIVLNAFDIKVSTLAHSIFEKDGVSLKHPEDVWSH